MHNERDEMGKPPMPFLPNWKNICIMEKVALNIPCFGCTVEHFVSLINLICFTAFGNLDFLKLLCEEFSFNVYKKKHYLSNFGQNQIQKLRVLKKTYKNGHDSQKFIPQNTMFLGYWMATVSYRSFFHKQFLPLRFCQYMFVLKHEKTTLALRNTWLRAWNFSIYFFPCCNGDFQETWLTDMLSAWFMRIFIYFCSYIYFTYCFLSRPMRRSNFKHKDGMIIVNL